MKRRECEIILMSFLAALSFWIVDTLIDTKFLSHESFLSGLFSNRTELGFRMLVSVWFLLFGGAMAKVFSRQKVAEDTLQKEVTERKRIEKTLRDRENFLQNILETEPECVKLIAPDKTLLMMNPAGLSMIEADSLEQVRGKQVSALVVKEHRSAFDKLTEEVFQGKSGMLEFGIVGLKGQHLWLETHAVPLRNEEGEINALLGITRDITKRKTAEDRLRKSLREKELLLREIHHRVKNNMVVISSLLRIQSGFLCDPRSVEIFRESQNRIGTMMRIYDKLYRSPDLTTVNFNEYISDLTTSLFDSYNLKPDRVTVELKLADAPIDIEKAIPCGLIINELISNALKYGFPDGRKGKITVSLHPLDENVVELVVCDDGIGMPDSVDIHTTNTFGVQLVSLLVKQLGGECQLKRENGTEFRISFNVGKI